MEIKKTFRGVVPAFWADPDTARGWLLDVGWVVGKERAKRGSDDIPAPRSGFLYDLHDVACVEGTKANDIVARIKNWAVKVGYEPDSPVAGCGDLS
jgi:hypothetical protein